jgi:hypothetical protein
MSGSNLFFEDFESYLRPAAVWVERTRVESN